MVSFPLFN